MTILRIDHVGIAVADLDAAIAFYRDTFGIVSMHEEVNAEQGVREAMLAAGDGSSRIQLLAPLDARLHHREVPRPQRPGHPADGLQRGRHRRDLGRAARARGCGCSTTSPAAAPPDSRINFVHPKDAGGVLIELVEPAAEPSAH